MDTRRLLRGLTFAACAGLLGQASQGQISITSLPYTPATTTFDAFNPTNSGNFNSTIPAGWSGSGASYQGRATGTGNSGGFYGYGTAGDFSLGALRSGSNNYTYTVSFQNNSGSTIESITLSWDYEQWRYANDSGWDCSGTGQLAGNTTLNSKDFVGSGTGTNGTPTTTAVASFTLSGLSIANGQSFGITWVTTDGASSDNGVAIDNFTISASAPSGPNLSASNITAFGSHCIGATAGPNTFTITGADLTTDDVTVSSTMPEYTFATDAGGPYSNPLDIVQGGGAFSETVYVHFTPTAASAFNGNVVVGGGGASSVNKAVTGSGANTAPFVTTGSASNLSVNSADVDGTITADGCSAVTAYGIEYSTTNGFTNGSGTQVAGGTLNVGAYTSSLSGLAPCTTYYFKAYATNDGGTTYGTQGSFSTTSIGTPVTIAASGVSASGFTANWNAVAGATSYRLDVSTSATFGTSTPGTSTTEIFSSIGGGSASSYLTRNWTGVDGVTWTATNARTDQVVNAGDAICLQNTAGSYLESGSIAGGVTAISFDVKMVFTGSGGILTVKVLSGPGFATSTTIGTIGYNATTATFSESFAEIAGPIKIRVENNAAARPAIDDLSFTRAAAHTPSFVPGYNDLTVSGTSQAVSGLASETTYYYRVRAVGGACTTDNSNTTNVTTGGTCTENITVDLRTDANSQEASWEILEQNADVVLCSGGSYPPNITTPITDNCCLPAGCYRLRVMDSGGDGFVTGGYQLRESGPNGRRIIDNLGNFSTGSVSAIASTYDNGAFCVPVGDDKLIFSSCDKLDWVDYKFIVVADNPAVSAQYGVSNANSGYEFWFFDPNGSYSFRRFRSHATSDGYGTGALRANHFKVNGWTNSVATPHIPANVLLNVRVRGRVAGNNLAFGPACLFKIDTGLAACPRVKLQDDPANTADYSCGVYRNFGGGSSPANRIYANPPQPVPSVASSNVRYQFRFRIPGEGICIVRPPQTSAQMTLNWTNGPALQCTRTYEVDVRVSLDGGATWCFGPSGSSQATACADSEAWGKVCNVTINACAQQNGGGNSMAVGNDGQHDVTLYPNPSNGSQLFVNMSSVEQSVRTVSLDIFDLTGKKVIARTIAVNDGSMNTALDLNGELANGMYLVNITAGSKAHTERLVIQH